jgi:NADP-dependent 3-hydroxy acid dehydrogenase YdfG
MRLQGKVVLVTGAAGGIGYAVTELFAREGATVFASDIKSPATPYPDGVQALTLDVTSEGDWQAAVDRIIERGGRLDVLINNAGIIAYEALDELDIKDWLKLIAVDQTGVFLGMREAVRVMRRQKSGSIVNVSSIWGSAAVAGAHSHHAAKGAVKALIPRRPARPRPRTASTSTASTRRPSAGSSDDPRPIPPNPTRHPKETCHVTETSHRRRCRRHGHLELGRLRG